MADLSDRSDPERFFRFRTLSSRTKQSREIALKAIEATMAVQ
jgi:hypothetical protein